MPGGAGSLPSTVSTNILTWKLSEVSVQWSAAASLSNFELTK